MRSLRVFCLSCLIFSFNAYADEPPETGCADNPRECFDGFEDDDEIKTKTGKAERTFSFPPVKAGFIFDFRDRDLLPHLSVEIVDFDIPKLGDFTFDVGLATSRVFTSLTYEFIPVIKAGPSIWVGYNIKQNDVAFGIGVSLLNF